MKSMNQATPQMKQSDKAGITGRLRFITRDSITGEIKRVSEWSKNLIVNGTNTGINIVADVLAGDNTNPLAITRAKIGTGTNTPANGDTDLQTPTYTITSVASASVSGGVVTLSFFIPTASLPNGTYTEFGIFALLQLFARAIISPSYVKGTNEDTTVEYQITVSNT